MPAFLALGMVSCIAAQDVATGNAIDRQAISEGSFESDAQLAEDACIGSQVTAESMPALAHMLVDTSLSMDELAPGSKHSK